MNFQNKPVFLFPGQGSQKKGMGIELYETFPEARALFDQADKIIDFPLSRHLLESEEDVLKQTEIAQPALYLISYAWFRVLTSKGITAGAVAGHSVGEYAALASAGVFSFEDGLRVVRQRGIEMKKAADAAPGSMAAVIGLDALAVEQACEKASLGKAIVSPANYNSPGQIVISGDADALERASSFALEAGAKKVVRLKVSGPWHCSLMKNAEIALEHFLEKIDFFPPSVAVVQNFIGFVEKDPIQIKKNLISQVCGSVKWYQGIQTLISSGFQQFVELGPGGVLSVLMRKIDRSVSSGRIENKKTLQKFLDKMEANE